LGAKIHWISSVASPQFQSVGSPPTRATQGRIPYSQNTRFFEFRSLIVAEGSALVIGVGIFEVLSSLSNELCLVDGVRRMQAIVTFSAAAFNFRFLAVK
jgi:hypothetical protein